ncbi:MAG: type I-C CRISPR-associated protein Cas8c/Csd1 [Deltaproteobacteria bacterium]|jgi:CRISPR-associated protein Csd1|nr:type I-C CRISPR-associated protein Cas8c/Csd1 [Deltaproteobacteria bacterium]
MILQALSDYYDRLRDNSETDIPLPGFGRQKIHCVLVINRRGELLQTKDIRETLNKKQVPKQLTTPEGVKRASNIAPNFMWDNTSYVLGAGNKENNKRILQCFSAFRELHHIIGDNMDDDGMAAVLSFLDSWNPEDASNLSHWNEMAGMNLVFQLDGDLQYMHERPKIQRAWLKYYKEKSSDQFATCLVSGKQAPISRLHPKIKGVRGAQTSGAAIISFNLEAFLSYDKKQNFNAPVSEAIAFAYTTALNHLLRFESRQKVRIGDAATVFWTERASPIEGFMGMVFDPQGDAGDTMDIRLFLEAVRDGNMPSEIGDPDIKFYILGLSPNASRLSIRFWHVSTVEDISAKIGQHFRDLSIIKNYDSDPEFPGIWQLLRETAVLRKTENISPVLSGSIIRSIMTGAAYPQSLMTAIIGRIRADQEINYLRAAMIKACLVRKYSIKQISKEVTMALDKESTNVAYRLGRLFAVLEKAQKDAVPGANTTIKDRFYGSASATPRTVFPQLLRLTQHHIQKAEYGRNTDKMIEEIIQGIQEFPAHLRLDDQGLFAIGYYHQKKAFYTKTATKKEE